MATNTKNCIIKKSPTCFAITVWFPYRHVQESYKTWNNFFTGLKQKKTKINFYWLFSHLKNSSKLLNEEDVCGGDDCGDDCGGGDDDDDDNCWIL